MHDPCSLCTRRHQSQISDGDAEGQTQRPLPPGVPRRGAGQETPVPSPSCSPASPGQHGGAQDAWPPGTCADGAGRFGALQTRLRVGSALPRLRASVRARVKWGHPTCTAEAIRSGVRGSQPGPQQHGERTGPEGGHRRRDPWRARGRRGRARASPRGVGGRKSEASLTRPVRRRQGPSGTFRGSPVSCLFRLLKAPVSLAGGRTLLWLHSEGSICPTPLGPHVPSSDPRPPPSVKPLVMTPGPPG